MESVWAQQSVWSQAANRLKRSLGRSRTVALGLAIAGAVAATLATQVATLSSVAGKALALAAAVAVGLVPLARRGASPQAIREWTRARSVSEALKSEAYVFLAGVAPYRGPERDHEFADRTDSVARDAEDLLRHTAGITPQRRELPAVHDVDSYVTQRVSSQIDWYRQKARELESRLTVVRRAEIVLSALGVVLAAVAATFGTEEASAWVAVVTTVAAALTAHAAASRYEYQLVEYLRTAAELERLRDRHASSLGAQDESDDEFVQRCEHVISIQNEAWMAKWTGSSGE